MLPGRIGAAATPEIAPRLGTTVTAVSDLGSGFAVDFTTADGRGREVYDHVVNATWEGRLAIDASLGLRPERPWLWRLRRIARVLTPDASRLVSVTTLLGPFGDVANFGGGALFMSWYPSCRIGISREPAPSAWQPAASTEPGSGEAGLIDGLGAIVPGVATLLRRLDTRVRWLHGAVFAWGSSDIDDPGSYLHRRYEIGVHSHGRYHSIDTSKYTTAPLFALEAADRVCGKD